MKDIKDMTKEELIELEDAATLSANNMGAAQDIFEPDYGWILRQGKPTEAGIRFYKEKLEKK